MYEDYFKQITLLYFKENDYSLDNFLKNKLVKDSTNEKADDYIQRFNSDSTFAFEELVECFHSMWPNQTWFNENYEILNLNQQDSNLEFWSSKFQEKAGKDSRFVKDLGHREMPYYEGRVKHWVDHESKVKNKNKIHFPIFAYNNTYIRRLVSLLKRKFDLFSNTYQNVLDLNRNIRSDDDARVKEFIKNNVKRKQDDAKDRYALKNSIDKSKLTKNSSNACRSNSKNKISSKSVNSKENILVNDTQLLFPNQSQNLKKVVSFGDIMRQESTADQKDDYHTSTYIKNSESGALMPKKSELYLSGPNSKKIWDALLKVDKWIHHYSHYEFDRIGYLLHAFKKLRQDMDVEKFIKNRNLRLKKRCLDGFQSAAFEEIRISKSYQRKLLIKGFFGLLKWMMIKRIVISKWLKAIEGNNKYDLQDWFNVLRFKTSNFVSYMKKKKNLEKKERIFNKNNNDDETITVYSKDNKKKEKYADTLLQTFGKNETPKNLVYLESGNFNDKKYGGNEPMFRMAAPIDNLEGNPTEVSRSKNNFPGGSFSKTGSNESYSKNTVSKSRSILPDGENNKESHPREDATKEGGIFAALLKSSKEKKPTSKSNSKSKDKSSKGKKGKNIKKSSKGGKTGNIKEKDLGAKTKGKGKSKEKGKSNGNEKVSNMFMSAINETLNKARLSSLKAAGAKKWFYQEYHDDKTKDNERTMNQQVLSKLNPAWKGILDAFQNIKAIQKNNRPIVWWEAWKIYECDYVDHAH